MPPSKNQIPLYPRSPAISAQANRLVWVESIPPPSPEITTTSIKQDTRPIKIPTTDKDQEFHHIRAFLLNELKVRGSQVDDLARHLAETRKSEKEPNWEQVKKDRGIPQEISEIKTAWEKIKPILKEKAENDAKREKARRSKQEEKWEETGKDRKKEDETIKKETLITPNYLPNLEKYQGKTKNDIRNIERTKPKELAGKVFWELKDDKRFPLNTSQITLGTTVLTFWVPDSNGKNKSVESGVGMRALTSILPDYKVYKIDGKKAYRIPSSDVFLYENGEYAKVRSCLEQKIIPYEATDDDKAIITKLETNHQEEYAERDIGFALSDWLQKKGLDAKFSPETLDQFLADLDQGKIEGDEKALAAMKEVATKRKESWKKGAEIGIIPGAYTEALTKLLESELDPKSFRDMIIKNAAKYMGTPYLWGGQNDSGIDCSGLIVKSLSDLGITSSKFDRTAAGLYRSHCESISKDELQRGDFIFWDRGDGKGITHIAIFLGHNPDGKLNILDSSGNNGVSTRSEKYNSDKHRYFGRLNINSLIGK